MALDKQWTGFVSSDSPEADISGLDGITMFWDPFER